jgi:hypothetical protein
MKKGSSTKMPMPKMTPPKGAHAMSAAQMTKMMKGGKKMKRFEALFVLVALMLPFAALAQEATGPTFKGFDLTPVIAGLVAVIGALLTWVSRKVASSQAASADKSRAETAAIRLAAIGLAMVGDLWDEMSREFQLRIADGEIDADDREAFRHLVSAKIEQYTSADELKKIAEALGLPLPGIIARVAEYAIDRLTKAHDPSTPEVSAKAYPVAADPEGSFGG